MQRSGRLSNTAGAVLDPIVAIRQRLILAPDTTVSVDFVTGMAATRDEALLLVDRYRDHHLADRALDMAWSHGQVVSRQINATDADALLYGRLASSVLYMNPLSEPRSEFWLAINGDSPDYGDMGSRVICRLCS